MGKKISPYGLILLSFISLIIIGGILLYLPISLNKNQSITFFDAIFTATSAITVTGLVVNNVSVVFNKFGKLVIMILIQLGGLGILTFSSLIILLMYKKIGYNTKRVVREDLNLEDNFDFYKYIKRIFRIVFIIEFLGAVFLFTSFIRQFPLKKAIFYSIFHSISAFCNAGFALFSNNLENFSYSPVINITVILLIVLGGLGFSTIIEVYEYFRGNIKKFSITTKLILIVTSILLFLGTLLIFILEYNNNLLGDGIGNKLLVSLFQSVTTRTAGFNTVSLLSFKKTTLLIMIVFMFIGASPGSTGGGLKTTTLGVLFLGVYSSIRSKGDIVFSKRRISYTTFNKAIALFFIEIIYVIIAIILMTIFDTDKSILSLFFELVSALGTVGLSLGITENLTQASKFILIITMFLGRVGTLTAVYAFSRRLKINKYRYSEETMLIG